MEPIELEYEDWEGRRRLKFQEELVSELVEKMNELIKKYNALARHWHEYAQPETEPTSGPIFEEPNHEA